MNDNELASNLRDAPASAIVLLEDVDAVFVGRELQNSKGAQQTGVTFSGYVKPTLSRAVLCHALICA